MQSRSLRPVWGVLRVIGAGDISATPIPIPSRLFLLLQPGNQGLNDGLRFEWLGRTGNFVLLALVLWMSLLGLGVAASASPEFQVLAGGNRGFEYRLYMGALNHFTTVVLDHRFLDPFS